MIDIPSFIYFGNETRLVMHIYSQINSTDRISEFQKKKAFAYFGNST